ncbi:MAG: hypothetical protein H0X71_04945 [Rubrobacter sp.]|nr:hypothetical protein [Rubrobacter sp.]
MPDPQPSTPGIRVVPAKDPDYAGPPVSNVHETSRPSWTPRFFLPRSTTGAFDAHPL